MPTPEVLFSRDRYTRTDFTEANNRERDSIDRRVNVYVKSAIEDEFPYSLEISFAENTTILELQEKNLLGKVRSNRLSVDPSLLETPEEICRRISSEIYCDAPCGAAFVFDDRLSRVLSVTWYSKTQKEIDKILDCLVENNFCQKPIEENTILVNVWHRTNMGISCLEQKLERLSWEIAQKNYPENTRTDLSALVRLDPDKIRGRILLLNGEPGTGKSHFLQSLATEWDKWCQTATIWSPGSFLADENYVFSLLNRLKDDREEASRKKWNLLVMEDAGDLIGADGALSPGFSTLLNVSDGMLGLGIKLLFAITTNEPVTKIHKAIRRPGRLLKHVEIGRMTIEEANLWLKNNGSSERVSKNVTLAELFGIFYGESFPTEDSLVGFRP